ncbi:hypothetical protein G7K_3897-t1 [Saitoella complicata NRRL Y-17804]|uniref:Uncharacterized protein n=1 Tax=Saitoella complicata (strain BCRC 22490 / CBS 7301 / JCM 7358 / NBRC 10748 / NRRL Y-17804) TaxID=698492 RepID=A0A0E9NK27_SAICN|nr:hypothetical protein G7K_3897-t1 [Saitoella complicata NRRL Y-17804]
MGIMTSPAVRIFQAAEILVQMTHPLDPFIHTLAGHTPYTLAFSIPPRSTKTMFGNLLMAGASFASLAVAQMNSTAASWNSTILPASTNGTVVASNGSAAVLPVSTITTTVSSYTTVCPTAGVYTVEGETVTVTASTVLTITDCPCTRTLAMAPATTVTSVVSSYETVCPTAGVYVVEGETVTVASSTTITVTECPCTRTSVVWTEVTPGASSAAATGAASVAPAVVTTGPMWTNGTTTWSNGTYSNGTTKSNGTTSGTGMTAYTGGASVNTVATTAILGLVVMSMLQITRKSRTLLFFFRQVVSS